MITKPRRPGRIILVVAGVLLAGFVALAVYERFYGHQAWQKGDAGLQEEWAQAELIEGPEPVVGDWPQWRGQHRDGVAYEPGLSTQWSREGPKTLWRVPGGQGYSSFAVANGRAFTLISQGSQEVVLCLDAARGNELWRHASASPGYKQFPGPRSTPTVDEDRVYTIGSGGRLQCLDTTSGKLHWEHDLAAELSAPGGQWGQAFSPLIEGKLVITTPGGPGASLAAFDKLTGKLAWKGLDDRPGYSSPVGWTIGGQRQVVAFTGNSVVGVEPESGRPLWRYPWETEFQVNAATPLTLHARRGGQQLDYVLISSGYGRGCALLKISSGAEGSFTPQVVFENNHLCSHFASPVRRGDLVFGLNEATLVCMSLRSGDILWQERGFNKGSLLRVDGHLIVLGESGQLALFEATAEGPRELAKARVLHRRCWTMPVLANGRLYLRDESEMVCMEVGPTR
jgi:outer membrane protein assembly factor BamB